MDPRAMSPRQRQRDALERKALRARFEEAQKEGRLEELEIELGLKVLPPVDPLVEQAHQLLHDHKPEEFFELSFDLDAGQRHALIRLLSDDEFSVYEQALEMKDKEVNRT